MIKRRAVTDNQKTAIRALIAGGSIAYLGSSIRVRDKDLNPVIKITEAGFYQLKYNLKILRKSEKFGYILNKSAVLKLNGIIVLLRRSIRRNGRRSKLKN